MHNTNSQQDDKDLLDILFRLYEEIKYKPKKKSKPRYQLLIQHGLQQRLLDLQLTRQNKKIKITSQEVNKPLDQSLTQQKPKVDVKLPKVETTPLTVNKPLLTSKPLEPQVKQQVTISPEHYKYFTWNNDTYNFDINNPPLGNVNEPKRSVPQGQSKVSIKKPNVKAPNSEQLSNYESIKNRQVYGREGRMMRLFDKGNEFAEITTDELLDATIGKNNNAREAIDLIRHLGWEGVKTVADKVHEKVNQAYVENVLLNDDVLKLPLPQSAVDYINNYRKLREEYLNLANTSNVSFNFSADELQLLVSEIKRLIAYDDSMNYVKAKSLEVPFDTLPYFSDYRFDSANAMERSLLVPRGSVLLNDKKWVHSNRNKKVLPSGRYADYNKLEPLSFKNISGSTVKTSYPFVTKDSENMKEPTLTGLGEKFAEHINYWIGHTADGEFVAGNWEDIPANSSVSKVDHTEITDSKVKNGVLKIQGPNGKYTKRMSTGTDAYDAVHAGGAIFLIGNNYYEVTGNANDIHSWILAAKIKYPDEDIYMITEDLGSHWRGVYPKDHNITPAQADFYSHRHPYAGEFMGYEMINHKPTIIKRRIK